MKLVLHAHNREGETYPAYHVLVRHSPEYLGSETALVGIHLIYRFYYWIVRRSNKQWTEEEIRTVKLTLRIMDERGDRRYLEGQEAGRIAGEEHAIRMILLIRKMENESAQQRP